jgi:hypothetical protein
MVPRFQLNFLFGLASRPVCFLLCLVLVCFGLGFMLVLVYVFFVRSLVVRALDWSWMTCSLVVLGSCVSGGVVADVSL